MLELYFTLLCAGAVVGLVPYCIAKYTNKPILARMSWLWTMLAGLLFLQFPVAIVFTIVILVRNTDYGVPSPMGFAGYSPAGKVNTLGIKCLFGPLRGRTYSIGASGLMIGREHDCAIRFDEGVAGISRHHCSLTWANGSLYLTDLGSSYGTYMADGRRLGVQSPTLIAAGDRFYLGSNDNLFQIIIQV